MAWPCAAPRGCSGLVTAQGPVHCQEDREHQGQRLRLRSVLSRVTWSEEEGKARSPPCSPSEQSAAWPWHCCLPMPWQLLVLECPALPAVLSNLTCSSRARGIWLCLGSPSPAAGAPPPLGETDLSEGDRANAKNFLSNELLNTLG